MLGMSKISQNALTLKMPYGIIYLTKREHLNNRRRNKMNNDIMRNAYVLVSDYVTLGKEYDMSDEIQKAIDENPNRTLFFPDGIYYISKPILTPALPTRSVSLKLANYAVIKAWNWVESFSYAEGDIYNRTTVADAMIRLGGCYPANDTNTNGSNYFLEGGVIDGSDVANGVSIDSGRETRISNVSIKNTIVGLHIKKGANCFSSDADIDNVNIVGSGTQDSIGVLCRGHDNTFNRMRIVNIQIGFELTGNGNFLRDIHPLYANKPGVTENRTTYEGSIAFYENGSASNIFDTCYSDQQETAFLITGGKSLFTNCWCFWYADWGVKKAFICKENFRGSIVNPKIDYNDKNTNNVFFYCEAGDEGTGQIIAPIMDPNACKDGQNNFEKFLKTPII